MTGTATIEIPTSAAGTAADVLEKALDDLMLRSLRLKPNQRQRRREIDRQIRDLTPVLDALRVAERQYIDEYVAAVLAADDASRAAV